MKDFLIELIKRFLSKTPKFFKVVKAISVIVALITGIPALLEQANIVLPDSLNAIASKVVSIAALISAFISQLTTTDAGILFKNK